MRKLLKTVVTIVSLGLMWPAIAQAEEPVWRYHPDNDRLPGYPMGLYQLESRLLHVRSAGLFLSKDGGITWAKLEVEGMERVDQFFKFKGRYFITERSYIIGYTGVVTGSYINTATENADGYTTTHVYDMGFEQASSPRVWVSEDGLIWERLTELESGSNGSLSVIGGTLVYQKFWQDTYHFSRDGINWSAMEKPPGEVFGAGENLFSVKMHMPSVYDYYTDHYESLNTKVYKLADDGKWKEVFKIDHYATKIKEINKKWFLLGHATIYASTDDLYNWHVSNLNGKGTSIEIIYSGGYYNAITSYMQTPANPAQYSHFKSSNGIDFETVVVNTEDRPEISESFTGVFGDEVNDGSLAIKYDIDEHGNKKYYYKNNENWVQMSFDENLEEYKLHYNYYDILTESYGVFTTYVNGSIYFYTENEHILQPPLLEVVENSSEIFTLSWIPVNGSQYYQVFSDDHVYIDEKYEKNIELLATTTGTSFTDTNITENSMKKYYVVPVAEGKIGMASRKVPERYVRCATYNPDFLGYDNVWLTATVDSTTIDVGSQTELAREFPVVKMERNAILGPVEVQYAPWIWSGATGWAYAHPEAEAVAGQFFYVGNVGWVWSQAECYPFVYDFTGETWVWVAPWSDHPWFELRGDGSVIEVENPITRSNVN